MFKYFILSKYFELIPRRIMTQSCLPVFLVNYLLVLIIISETELEISGHVVERFWSNKSVF